MKPFTNRVVYTLVLLLTCATVSTALAEAKSNPYQAIIERNPFGLKPPPPPPDPTPVVVAAPPGKVILTGITTMFGPPRALLEVTEQETGKAPTVHKPILHEGEREGGVEVISIDLAKSMVKIRLAGIETNVTFETPKLTASAPILATAGGFPPPAGAMSGAPAPFSPANAGGNNLGRGGVTMFGNSGSSSIASPRGSYSGASPTSASPGGYGGYGAAGVPTLGAAATDNSALRSIPSRTIRSDSAGINHAPIDPAKQYLEMAVDHELHSSAGHAYPPLPPPPR